ncbi:hypothetical protein [Streptomyces sp. NPDC014793]|uniref:hypothetical protein n=1 Tax=Streptomyces sp. NPDC014793 TaxID=3364914 RepID=UPI0036FE1BB0
MENAGRYRMLRRIGTEPDLLHWLAHDAETRRPLCAVQVEAGEGTDGAVTDALAERCFTRSTALLSPMASAVARTVAVVRKGRSLCLVEERPPGCHLADFLSRHRPSGPEIAGIALALLGVLSDVHAKGFAWGYIAAQQVWVQADLSVVLSGSGVADLVALGWVAQHPSRLRFAPELSPLTDAAPSADMWALGNVMAGMLAGGPNPLPGPATDGDVPAADLDRLLTGRARAFSPLIHGLLRRDTAIRLTEPIVRRALIRVSGRRPAAGYVSDDWAETARRPGAPVPLPPPPDYPPDSPSIARARQDSRGGRHRLRSPLHPVLARLPHW